MTARTLKKEFEVGVVAKGQHNRANVTLTWTSDVPMEFKLHVWTPVDDGDGVTVIWSVSRDVLVEVTDDDAINAGGRLGMGDICAKRVVFRAHPSANGEPRDWVYLHLDSPDGAASLTFETAPLAAFIQTSLAMVPREDEVVDVDAVIQQIFQSTKENEA